MATQVLRIETRDSLDGKLLRHCRGESRPAHARSSRTNVLLRDGADAAKSRIAEIVARKRGRGRPPKRCVDMVFAGPPPYAPNPKWNEQRVRRWKAESREWDEDRILDWAKDTLAWIDQLFPGCPIAVAAVHRDESSPHLHVLMVPEIDDRLSWKACKLRAVRSAAYRVIQDRYHKDVARKYGLGRGERGSRRKHTPLSQAEGMRRADWEDEIRIKAEVDAKMGKRWSRKGRAQRREIAKLKKRNAELAADLAQANRTIERQHPDFMDKAQEAFDRRKKLWAA